MTSPIGPVYALAQQLPTIPVTCYAGQPLTITVPVLGATGAGVDVSGLDAAHAHIRPTPRAAQLLHQWVTEDTTAEITGTVGGSDAAVVLHATGADTALWQDTWPRLDVVWDVEVVDSAGEPHRLCAASAFLLLPEVTRAG